MPSPDEAFDDVYHAEIAGRRTRTTRFKIRPVRGNEVMDEDPARYILEITKNNHSHLHAISEADMSALHRVTGGALFGEIPIEG